MARTTQGVRSRTAVRKGRKSYAKVAKKTSRRKLGFGLGLFCDFCETFATFASGTLFGCLALNYAAPTNLTAPHSERTTAPH